MNIRLASCFVFAIALVLAGCGPSSPADDDQPDGGIPELPDEDGDGIADEDEGRPSNANSDDDDVPDYLDEDSDNDGIPDYREAGDELTGTPPVDSDGDNIPDFRDTDSDDNGRLDGVDGVADLDGDEIGNFADLDDDGDSLLDEFEIAGLPESPPDSDNDDAFDFQDTDSDADRILDFHERANDPDLDEIPAYVDTDSDNDCVADIGEAGDADLQTAPVDSDDDARPDFLDRDSDNDGLLDGAEDANCNGVQDGGESSPIDEDSDGDGVSDMVELAAGTDPNNNADNPQQNGDFVFIVPYEELPDPEHDDLDFSTELAIVDLYVLLDISGSMSDELSTVRGNMQTVLNNLTCPPLGSGTPGDCIEDLWSGAGTFTYEERDAYVHRLDLQSNPAQVGPALPTSVDNDSCSPCAEAHNLATWATCTGQGSATSGCSPDDGFAARASCAGSPIGAAGIGYPCFRPDALPVILLATDESPTSQFYCPTFANTAAAANAIGAKIIGIHGTGTAAWADLETLASLTGAVDVGGNELVFAGADAGAATAIQNAVKTLANSVPLDISATAVDDGADAVEAVAAFVHHLETLQLGTAECTNGLTDQDTNSDSFPDLYVDVLPGTPVCWRLVPKTNTTVEATEEPQLYRATIEVRGDGTTLLDTRDVYFLVPPEIEEEPIN